MAEFVRILNAPVEKLKDVLRSGGMELLGEELIEDRFYDHEGLNLWELGVRLRIRRRSSTRGTRAEWAVRSPAVPAMQTDGWSRYELANDMAAAEREAWLTGLGFTIRVHREKRRETYGVEWQSEPLRVHLDTYPGVPTFAKLIGDWQVAHRLVDGLEVPRYCLTQQSVTDVLADAGVADPFHLRF